MPWFANMSREGALKFKPEPRTVCVSITDPGAPSSDKHLPKLEGYDDILRLAFHDYRADRPHPDAAVLFNRDQASRLALFLYTNRGCNFLVHCEAGISRSGAVVEVIKECFPEYEDVGWQRWPNSHVRRLLRHAMGLPPDQADLAS